MNFKQIKFAISLFILLISTLSCKTRINQTKNNLQEGKWITIDTLDYPYISKGKYRRGKPIGTWTYINNNKLDRKEKYKKDKCLTMYYHPNGRIKQKGYTKENETHWYYSGEWNYFDENGSKIRTNIYEKGNLIDSIMPKKDKKTVFK